MTKSKKIPIIIDTDPGVDDAASLFWVLANPRFDIKAITIANGNVSLKQCAVNALKILEVAGRSDIPVYIGAENPLFRKTRDAAWVHGADGLGDAGFDTPKRGANPGYAPAEMARIAAEDDEPVTILALAPLTNVALAVQLDAKFKEHVKQVLFMGGAVRVPGNESPAASFNAAVDPEAAKIVYNSGVTVVQLGLDVCDKVRQSTKDLEDISSAGTAVGSFIAKMLEHFRNAKKVFRNAGGEVLGVNEATSAGGEMSLNDLTATAYLINPDWFETLHCTIDVDTAGLCPGQTIVDFRGMWGREKNAYWAYNVDARAAMYRWVSDICSYISPKH